MSKQKYDWGSLTRIDSTEIDKCVYKTGSDSDGKVYIESYCVDIGAQGWSLTKFGQFLEREFPEFVLPPAVREETKRPLMNKAREEAAPNFGFYAGGVISEYLLYLFTEAYLDMPQVSYRLHYLDDADQEVKGSDGLFVGTFNNEEVVGVGEAKFPDSISNGLEEAEKSIKKFHGVGSQEEMRRELNIAGSNIDDLDLDTSELNEISKRISHSSFEDYPIVHPIFIGYQTAKLDWMPEGPSEDEIEYSTNAPDIEQQVKEKIEGHFSNTEYFKKIDDYSPDIRSDSGTAILYFIFFPVHNTREFKEEVYKLMFFPESKSLDEVDIMDKLGVDKLDILESLDPDEREKLLKMGEEKGK